MTRSLRITFVLAILALAAGWWSLRTQNAALERAAAAAEK